MKTRQIAALVSFIFVCLFVSRDVSAAAPSGRRVTGSFEAIGVPQPPGQAPIYPYLCHNRSEGAHHTAVSFKAPFTGRLEATLHGFRGDWDLYVVGGSPEQRALAGSEEALAVEEKVQLPLRAGEEVQVVACNWRGGPNAVVDWSLTESPYPRTPPPTKQRRTAKVDFFSGSATTTVVPAHFNCLQFGCPELLVRPGERGVGLLLKDWFGRPVGAIVTQKDTFGGSKDDVVCGEGAIDLLPFAEVIEIKVGVGPCPDGTPTSPIWGSVTATFSGSKP